MMTPTVVADPEISIKFKTWRVSVEVDRKKEEDLMMTVTDSNKFLVLEFPTSKDKAVRKISTNSKEIRTRVDLAREECLRGSSNSQMTVMMTECNNTLKMSQTMNSLTWTQVSMVKEIVSTIEMNRLTKTTKTSIQTICKDLLKMEETSF